MNNEKMSNFNMILMIGFLAITLVLAVLAVKGLYVEPEMSTNKDGKTGVIYKSVNLMPVRDVFIMDTVVVYGSRSGKPTKVKMKPSNMDNPVKLETIAVNG